MLPITTPQKYTEPPKDQYEHIHAAADAHEDELRKAFLSAVTTMRAGFVGVGDINLDPLFYGWGDVYSESMELTYRDGYTAAVKSVPFPDRMDLATVNPRAVAWASEYSGKLITEVTENTRAGIRRATAATLDTRLTRYQYEAYVRGSVGLHSRYVAALENYTRNLVETGVTGRRLEQMITAKANFYLDLRVGDISRTELMTAANWGQYGLWEDAAAQGLFLPSEWERLFIVTPDDRLCEICRPMTGQVVEVFDTPYKVKLANGAIAMVLNPPIHVRCRCTTAIRRKR